MTNHTHRRHLRPVATHDTLLDMAGATTTPAPTGPLLDLSGATPEEIATGWNVAHTLWEQRTVTLVRRVLDKPVRPIVPNNTTWDHSTAPGPPGKTGRQLLQANIPPCDLPHLHQDNNPYSHTPCSITCLLNTADGTTRATYVSGAGIAAGTWADRITFDNETAYDYGNLGALTTLLLAHRRKGALPALFLEEAQTLNESWYSEKTKPFTIADAAETLGNYAFETILDSEALLGGKAGTLNPLDLEHTTFRWPTPQIAWEAAEMLNLTLLGTPNQ